MWIRDSLVSCVPLFATESQYPLIWAAKEAGVERFVPSEFGYIYEWEQFWPTDTVHKTMSRQKAFIRRMIEMTGMDFTIIPAGLLPADYLVETVGVLGGGGQKFSWSTGRDVGRIIYSLDFRRLRHKTQVFFDPQNDHICTRMEHVIYVSYIANTIGRELGLNADLIQGIALGHALGHATFGHSGERVLDACLKKISPD